MTRASRADRRAVRRARPAAGLRALAILVWAILATAALPPAATASPDPRSELADSALVARALGIDDGDSFVARQRDGTKIRVRLAGIDAPEKAQPWAAVARRHLRELLDGRELKIRHLKTDRWGRFIAIVDADGVDPALAMLEAGLAWHFERYDRELPIPLRQRYAQAQETARKERAGLWRGDDPEPPWEFRLRTR